MGLLKKLQERGFIEQIAGLDLEEKLKQPVKLYCGFDPTGDSLHVGHLVPILGLKWFLDAGHHPIALIGGATGMIGDPSGKSTERNLLTQDILQANIRGIEQNLKQILKSEQVAVLNNDTWLSPFSFLSFLRDVGKYFRLGSMLSKESVRLRLESEEGISFTEFSYQLLQAYDFHYLSTKEAVVLQIGGSDQWGNITAGIELSRKLTGTNLYGLTLPLLTRSDGQKFGKSESGAIWLSEHKLPVYEFYQYFIRTHDADVIKFFKLLTFLEMDEISKIEREMEQEDYVPNSAQKRLAEEVTRIVHGEQGIKKALDATKIMNPGSATTLTPDLLEKMRGEVPFFQGQQKASLGKKLVDLLVEFGVVGSKGEAKRLIQNGGLYLNNNQVKNMDQIVLEDDLIGEKFLLISLGKKTKSILSLE